jgi:hypothetical protein
MMRSLNISAILSVMILLSKAETRYGTQLIGRALPVSMAFSVMSVNPKLPSAGGKHHRRRAKSLNTTSLSAADKF